MAVPDGWPPARASGCTEPGLQAASPAACLSCHLQCVLAGLYRNRRHLISEPLTPGMHPLTAIVGVVEPLDQLLGPAGAADP